MLPGTLKEISQGICYDCAELTAIWVKDGCTADVRKSVRDSVKIYSAKDVMIRDKFIWDVPKLKKVIIPEGLEKIQNS